jgi:hypothetical protein
MNMRTMQVRALMLSIAMLAAALPLTGRGQTPPAPAGAVSGHIPRPDELEPGVDTTKTPDTPSRAAPPVAAPASVPPGAAAPPAARATASSAAPVNGAPAAKTSAKKGADRLELETTDVTGNSELPKVLYIVPWKRSDIGDMAGRPVNSLLDEVLQPLDRDVFKRENRYYEALKPEGSGLKSDAPQGSGAKP